MRQKIKKIVLVVILLFLIIQMLLGKTEIPNKFVTVKNSTYLKHFINDINYLCQTPVYDFNDKIAMKYYHNDRVHFDRRFEKCEIKRNQVELIKIFNQTLRLDTEILKTKYQNIKCSLEKFDKKLNESEMLYGIAYQTKEFFDVKNNYEIKVNKYGFYYVKCMTVTKNKEFIVFSNVYSILPLNMSELLEERLKYRNIIKKLPSPMITSSEKLTLLINEKSENNLIRKRNRKYNVFAFGIDSMSRSHFRRTMPETFKYLTEELSNNIAYKNIHSVGVNTLPNLVPFLTGISGEIINELNIEYELPFYREPNTTFHDLFPFIWNEYEEQGYLTHFNTDIPRISFLNYLKQGFRFKPTSYYTRPYWTHYYRIRNGPFLCHNGVPTYRTYLNSIRSFIERMNEPQNKDIPYFSFNFMAEMTHDQLAIAPKFDENLKKMLKDFEKKGYFDNTLFILFTDHGIRIIPYTYETQIGKLEKSQPFFSMRLPNSLKNSSYYQNCYVNKNKLFGFFDVYQTLRQFSHLNDHSKTYERSQYSLNSPSIRYKRGISLFELIPQNRSCVDAFISDRVCICNKINDVSPEQFYNQTNITLNQAIKQIIQHVNNFTSNYRHLCTTYNLRKIVWVKKKVKETKVFYIFTLILNPGNAWFEVSTVLKAKSNMIIEEEPVRLSLYGSQANCIKDSNLRNFCFCKIKS